MIAKPHDANAAPRHCCLHIGMPKTATKTLQMCLFARHSQIDFLGTYTGKQRNYYRQCRSAEVERIAAELIWDRYEKPDLATCRTLFDKHVAPSFDRGLMPVWSWESLMENRPEVQRQRAENLREIFGPCKIVATIRHPIKLLVSLYLQLLKRDNVGGYAHFGSPIVYQPIDRWIDDNWDAIGAPPKAHLEYAEAVRIYADVFGDENVGVFLFEQLVNDPRAYYEGICRFIGINAEEAMCHVEGEKENQRWTDLQLQRLESIQASPVKSTIFRFASRPIRRQMLGLPRNSRGVPTKGSKGAELSIPPHLMERICEKTRAGNRWLQEHWGLPLESFQYPV